MLAFDVSGSDLKVADGRQIEDLLQPVHVLLLMTDVA